MAIEEAETLVECRYGLKEKLDSCLARKDDPSPQKRFARRGITREIFEEKRLERLIWLLHHESPDVSHLNVPADLNSLAKKLRGSEASPNCSNNVLAILLYSQCENETIMDFIQCLLLTERKPTFDSDLPLTKEAACKAFGNDDGNKVWEHQLLFCPVILEERKEVKYVDHRQSCPLPFVEDPKIIGRGAYAFVYKVKIEKGHLISDQGVNDRKEYAMKKFIGYDAEAKKSFDAEGSTIAKFIQCAKSHDNIATTKASLELGNTYSLFFDLAKCNLWEYFMDTTVTMETLEEKRRVFSRTIGLAGALAYLHDELHLDSESVRLQCYHLDLKPQNILVFERNGEDIWKIADFGISQIKRIPFDVSHHESEQHVSFFDKVFHSKTPDPSSGVDNSRYGGTYAAPEAKEKSDTVTRKSDVWSLACVITLVLTFLHNQSHGIKQFQESRERDRSHDWFFDSKALKTGSETKEILHNSVMYWLNTLNTEALRRDEYEAEATRKATELLKSDMFLRDQEKRLSAKKVETKLMDILSLFKERPVSPSEKPTPVKTRTTEHSVGLHLPWPTKSKEAHKTTSPQESWSVDIPRVPHTFVRCKFNADGEYLCITSKDEIAINSISDIQRELAGTRFPSPKNKNWVDFSIGSKYLCATVDSEHFECSYLLLSPGAGDNLTRCDRNASVKCRIRKVAIAPNDEITAFVLEDSQQGKKTLRVALYCTQDLIGAPKSSNENLEACESSSISRTSTTASTPDDMPWRDIMRSSRDSELPTGAQLADLKFSRDGKILMAITEPFIPQEGQGMQYEVITWDVANGQRYSPFGRYTKGYDGMERTWSIDTFAAFAHEPAFAAISKNRIRWGTYDPPEYKIESKPLSEELLDILVTDEEDEVVVVGRSNGKLRAGIDAFRVSTSKIQGLESLGDGVFTGSSQYNRMTDCCCLAERDDKTVIRVATINTNRLYEKVLE